MKAQIARQLAETQAKVADLNMRSEARLSRTSESPAQPASPHSPRNNERMARQAREAAEKQEALALAQAAVAERERKLGKSPLKKGAKAAREKFEQLAYSTEAVDEIHEEKEDAAEETADMREVPRTEEEEREDGLRRIYELEQEGVNFQPNVEVEQKEMEVISDEHVAETKGAKPKKSPLKRAQSKEKIPEIAVKTAKVRAKIAAKVAREQKSAAEKAKKEKKEAVEKVAEAAKAARSSPKKPRAKRVEVHDVTPQVDVAGKQTELLTQEVRDAAERERDRAERQAEYKREVEKDRILAEIEQKKADIERAKLMAERSAKLKQVRHS
jgi:hypothetical protein